MIPAGIETGFNIYRYGGDVRVLVDGRKYNYADLPDGTRAIFRTEMEHGKGIVDLLTRMGCPDKEAQELKFVGCRFGSLNQTADLNGETTHPDAPNCQKIGNCVGYGTVCLIPEGLTKREYHITRLIAEGLQDKEICNLLDIALPTLHTYMERIHGKLHLNNKVEVALWGQRNGVI